MFPTVPINSSRYSPVLCNSLRSNSVEPFHGKHPSTKSATSSGRSAIKVTSPVTQPITSEPLGEATGISTTPHTAGHPSVPLKHHPGEVLQSVFPYNALPLQHHTAHSRKACRKTEMILQL
ncbi:hypothetical protein BDR06DRAFT_1005912 [Suillus hirtellus]|nr:hypothetical protein BDR06DRAFT_1005912 [Suillus hirtellus]